MESFVDRHIRKVFDFVIGASRGGPTRLMIIEKIGKKPMNTNQITKALGMDYKTIEYHMRVLKENGIVSQTTDKYGSRFSVSPLFSGWEKVHKSRRGNRN